jgi:hypothetical protein
MLGQHLRSRACFAFDLSPVHDPACVRIKCVSPMYRIAVIPHYEMPTAKRSAKQILRMWRKTKAHRATPPIPIAIIHGCTRCAGVPSIELDAGFRDGYRPADGIPQKRHAERPRPARARLERFRHVERISRMTVCAIQRRRGSSVTLANRQRTLRRNSGKTLETLLNR